MTKSQKILRFTAILATLFAFLALSESFSIIHQGEDQHWLGFLIIWSARLGTIGLAVAIALAAVLPRWAFHCLWLSALAVSPLVAMIVYPPLWCLFLSCGQGFDEFIWEPFSLLFPAALGLAVGGFYFSKPE